MLDNLELKKSSDSDFKKLISQKIFYKYASLNIAIDYIIKEQELKFTSPTEFNDPFDCNEEVLQINMDKSMMEHYAKQSNLDLTRTQRRAMVRTAHASNSHMTALKNKKKSFKVCCFSTKPDNVLMWSHYGDKHNGICLGFELSPVCDDYAVYPVNYISKVEKIDGMTNTGTVFNYWLTRKSICWEYESEMRAISVNGPDKIKFEKGILKEVLFGCNVKESVIKATIKLIKKQQYKKILFKKLELDKATFGLKIRNL